MAKNRLLELNQFRKEEDLTGEDEQFNTTILEAQSNLSPEQEQFFKQIEETREFICTISGKVEDVKKKQHVSIVSNLFESYRISCV